MDRRTRTLVVVGLAVVLATLASIGVYQAIRRMPVREVAIPQRYQVVAKERIPVGALILKEQVRLTPWPAEAPVPGGFTKIDDVVGRGVIAEVLVNEPLSEAKVAPRDSGAGLPPSIPPGMRAMSVRVNDVIGVAGFAAPGTRVDVIVTVKANGSDPVSRAVLSDIQVLAAGTAIDRTKAKEGEPMPTSVVTLLVTPQDAERLALAQGQGEIVLALRNPLDTAPPDTRGARLAALIGAPDPKPVLRPATKAQPPRMVVPAPATPPPPGPYTVDTIRAAKRTEDVIK
jgi:pilus assembly protein CpaB